jgi:hypothetical protein
MSRFALLLMASLATCFTFAAAASADPGVGLLNLHPAPTLTVVSTSYTPTATGYLASATLEWTPAPWADYYNVCASKVGFTNCVDVGTALTYVTSESLLGEVQPGTTVDYNVYACKVFPTGHPVLYVCVTSNQVYVQVP